MLGGKRGGAIEKPSAEGKMGPNMRASKVRGM